MSSRQPVNLQRLLHELEGVIDWRGLGIELKIPYAELKKIDQDCRGKTEECKRELLHTWLCRVGDPTWSDVVEALRKMKLVNMAEKVEERCCHYASEQELEISAEVKAAVTLEDVRIEPKAAQDQGVVQPVPLDPLHEGPSVQAPRPSTQLESRTPAKAVPSSAAVNFPIQASIPSAPLLPLRPPEIAPARIEEIHSQVEVLQDKFLKLVCNADYALSERQPKSPDLLSRIRMSVFNLPLSRRKAFQVCLTRYMELACL